MLVSASCLVWPRTKGCTEQGLGAAVSKLSGCRWQRLVPHTLSVCSLRQSSQELPVEDLPDHSLPEIWHVLLCKVDWSVFGNAVGIFASKHSTVTSIHLLWDFLAFLAEELPAIGIKLFPFLVDTFLF